MRKLILVGTLMSLMVAAAPPIMAGPNQTQVLQPDTLVARIYYRDQTDLAQLAAEFDLWEVHQADRYVVAGLQWTDYLILIARGYRVEIDQPRTDQLNQPRVLSPNQVTGIPGYACYRTVEETFATAQAIVAAHPDLAEWIDIGDSWNKTQGSGGYDLMVLKLTNKTKAVPKDKAFIMASVHAREYTPAELNTRFAEHLINNYGVDADVTWLLDYNEIHLLLQSNPDGRKYAETGNSWRKNTNTNYCPLFRPGADLNRNFPFGWGGVGASTVTCSETYRGANAVSEPETQTIVNYVRALFPDQRPDDRITPAAETASGLFLDLHSYAGLVLWPWGDTSVAAPNAIALATLGRKFAYFNQYTPQAAYDLYPTSGTTDDFAYGELGLAAYTFELGYDSFFEACNTFESQTLPANLPALIYSIKAARRPYQAPGGPEVIGVTATPTVTLIGSTLTLKAIADGTRYAAGENAREVAAARYSVDAPTWLTDTVTIAMQPLDGTFDSVTETVTATVDTHSWNSGRHTLFVEAQATDGTWGVPTAVFVEVVAGGVPRLDPALSFGGGQWGATALHTLTMSNHGVVTDTFTIGAAGQTWPTALSQPTITLAPDQSAPLIVSVTLPASATLPAIDQVTVTLSGTTALSASLLTTLILPYSAYLPLVLK